MGLQSAVNQVMGSAGGVVQKAAPVVGQAIKQTLLDRQKKAMERVQRRKEAALHQQQARVSALLQKTGVVNNGKH